MSDIFQNTPYEFVSELFSTHTGGVFRVREKDAPSDDKNAYKIIKMVKKGHTKNDLDILRRDFDISQHLQHQPHIDEQIVKCEKFENSGINSWIVKSDDEGKSLKSYVEKCTTDEERLQLFWNVAPQLVKHVEALHRAHVLHLDLKPDNVLAIEKPDGELTVKLLDFSVSSIVSLQTPYIGVKFDSMFGTPQYMAPEQSGKMSSRIDKRADIYSLGCTLYSILTGKYVFSNCVTTKQWVNAHLKEIPEPISHHNTAVPMGIEKMIRKMMAKQPGSRYSSVRGIVKDLEEVQQGDVPEDWRAGTHDVNDQFSLPTKMYGRDPEYKQLVESLNAAEQQTRKELLLISGVSGVGKSRIVQELQFKYSSRAWFITSKYDQISSVPYQNLQTICSQVVSTLLTEEEKRLVQIKASLLENLNGLGVLLTNLVPGLEGIIGKQDPLPDLNAEELLNKMSQATLAFFKTISEEYSRMMVLFVDDLQWSAVNDLKILEKVLLDKSLRLLMIGSYRSNEVSSDHHLSYFIDSLKKANTRVTNIILDVLNEDSIKDYMSDLTLVAKSDPDLVALSQTVMQATQGNPFYVREIVNKMHLEGVFSFDYSKNCWSWDAEKIRSIQFASNVIDLMLSSIDAQLSEESQSILKVASCIGNVFSLDILALVSEKDLRKTDLMESVQAGWLVELEDDQYKWQHDKLQEAAYSMLGGEAKDSLHLVIGKAFMQKYGDDDSKLFKILGHLNKVLSLVVEDPELAQKVKDLNIKGCKQANNSNAFEMAISCANMAIKLMGDQMWDEDNYQDAYDVHVLLAFAYSSARKPDEAIATLEQASSNSKNTAHTIELASIIIQVNVSSNQLKEGYDKFTEILRSNPELTFNMPQQDKAAQGAWIGQRMQEIMPLLMQNLPTIMEKEELTDPVAGALIHLLGEGSPLALTHAHLDELLMPCICLLSGEYVLKYGVSEYTSIALANFAIAIGNITKDFSLCRQISRAGFEIGRNRYTQDKFLCHAYFSDACHCASEKTLTEFVDICESALRYGLSAGEYSWSTNCMLFSGYGRLITGWDLTETETAVAKFSKILTEIKNIAPLCMLNGMKQVIDIMKGERDTFTADEYPVPGIIHAGFLRLLHNISGSLAHIYLHEYEKAYEYSSTAMQFIADSETMLYEYAAPALHILVLSRLISVTEEGEAHQKYVEDLKETLVKMKKYDDNMEKMWKSVVALAETELKRLGESDEKADRMEIVHSFEEVISLAHNHKFMLVAHIAGLELAAYEKSIGLDARFVQIHLEDALRHAEFYGAYGYCGVLRTIYSEDMESISGGPLDNSTTKSSGGTNTISASGRTLAPNSTLSPSVGGASQATFGFQKKVNLEVLFHSMLSLVVEETTATRVGVVLSEQFLTDATDDSSSSKYFLQYIFENGDITKVAEPMPSSKIFAPVVNRVLRSRIAVVEEDMGDSELLSLDQSDYFQTNACMSLMVQPIIYNNTVAGALYLENSQTPGIFNKIRQNALKTLISVSLHSSQFYSKLNAAMSRFLPSQFLKQLGGKNIVDVMPNDCIEKNMAVLFLDIRSFTDRLEKLSAKSSFRFVNTFLKYTAPEIDANGGFIDKFIGDAIMSLFPDGTIDAVLACIHIMKKLEEMNTRETRDDPVRIGIGVHQGSLMLGTIGYRDRLDATVIADTVNTASRLEGLTKAFGVSILISRDAYDHALTSPKWKSYANLVRFRKVGSFLVKGKTIANELFEAYSPDWQVHTPEAEFEEILQLFADRQFAECIAKCDDVLAHHPTSKLSSFYKTAASMYSELDLPLSWSGEIKMNKDGDPVPAFPPKQNRKASIVEYSIESATNAKMPPTPVEKPPLTRALTPTRGARIQWSEDAKKYTIVTNEELKEQ